MQVHHPVHPIYPDKFYKGIDFGIRSGSNLTECRPIGFNGWIENSAHGYTENSRNLLAFLKNRDSTLELHSAQNSKSR